MTLKQTERLLRLLEAHGVTHFKSHDVEVTLGDQRVAGPSPAPKPIPSQPPDPRQPAPPSPAAAPPTESSIPHHVNEVQSLLRMSDNDLVDKLFPLPKGTEG